jgi:UDP-3-O-[3-hydroxymyristoyl] glucosamine N-acyltransferase
LDGHTRFLPQTGGVFIKDDVIFLFNSTVARSSFSNLTTIGTGCLFVNLVHVAYDYLFGNRVKMTARFMLSCPVTIEDDVYVGPNATLSNGLHIGERVQITFGPLVTSDVEPGKKVSGNFAMDHGYLNIILLIRVDVWKSNDALAGRGLLQSGCSV